MKKTTTRYYLDNAAGEPLRKEAVEAMSLCMEKYASGEYSNPSNIMAISGNSASKAMTEARASIASCIGALPEEITFTSGGTESNNIVIHSAVKQGLVKTHNPHVVVSAIEHKSVLEAVKNITAEYEGSYTIIPCPNGVVDVDILANAISENTCLVAVMMVNNEVGTIQPIKEIAKICSENKVPFLVDAVQAVGHIPIDVKDLGITYLSASGHKFGAPAGTGFLWHKKGAPLMRFSHGGGQEGGCRPGTENLVGIVGMEAALCASLKDYADNYEDLLYTNLYVRDKVRAKIPDCIINGEQSPCVPTTISLSFKDIDGPGLSLRLNLAGFTVSNGSACNASSKTASHVLKAMKVPKDYIGGTIRISLASHNMKTPDLAKDLVAELTDSVAKLRSFKTKGDK